MCIVRVGAFANGSLHMEDWKMNCYQNRCCLRGKIIKPTYVIAKKGMFNGVSSRVSLYILLYWLMIDSRTKEL